MNAAAISIRENILRISHHSKHGHIPTCFSIVEMLMGIYETIRHEPGNPQWPERDLFILSKGHAALGHYCTLAHYGFFPIQKVYSFGAFKSSFGCHADRMKVPGVDASTGSLGHGIGLAVGMALGLKLEKSKRRVYAIIGDGESNEGSVWEALMVGSHQGLANLTVLYDDNQSQTRCLPISNPVERFASFGWDTVSVNGHHLEEIKDELVRPHSHPKMIVCRTIKGYGCKSLVDNMFAWHRRSPTDGELLQLVEELHAK